MNDKTTFRVWLKEWLNTYKKPYVKPRTYKAFLNNIKNHIPERLRNKPLNELKSIDIQKAINNVNKPRIAQEIYNIYHGSLKMAYNLDIIQKDIAKTLIKPKHTQTLGKALTKKEQTDFIKALENTRVKNYFLFCLYSGCRRAEALSIEWQDVDVKHNKIHIKGTKTIKSDRYIPIFKNLGELLATIPKQENGKLFHHKADYLTKTFKKLCKNHKLHDLRHTFATRCIECGISLKMVQEWLGHASLQTTANIYSHCLQDFEKSESNKLIF